MIDKMINCALASMELNRITSREDDCCPIFPERFLPETTEPELTLTAERTIDLWTGLEAETGPVACRSPQLLTSPELPDWTIL
ncbi:MAG: hypothetical protein EBE86_011805 [Hormoscilla sp. GUM202]|nr:hypothetical protein [Hormoscilla sp. GUM202]